MTVSVALSGNRTVFTNDDGEWSIWRTFVTGSGGDVVGPGYIGRFKRPDGTLVVDDYKDSSWILNDPRFGGLGAFGCHVGRANGEPDVLNRTWDLTERRLSSGGLGVSATAILTEASVVSGVGRMVIENTLRDGYGPLFAVKRTYAVYDSRIEVKTDVRSLYDGSGPAAFVKEPKVVVHGLGVAAAGSPQYRTLDTFSKAGALLESVDLWSYPDPTIHTHQMGMDGRCRLRFADPEKGNYYFNAVLESGSRQTWEGATDGFDKWAQDANALPAMEASGPAYCLQGTGGTLTRKWEATRWASGLAGSPPEAGRPHVGVMAHAWEGGTGYPDCRNCFRQMPALGKTYSVWACYSFDAGWVV